MSDTLAVRKPVRIAARWWARIEAVGPAIRIGLLGVTGLATSLSALKDYGLGRYALPAIGAAILLGMVATWQVTEEGVLNQKNRDKKDMGDNFASPLMRIDDELIGSAVFAAVHKRAPTDDEQEAIAEAVDKPWRQHRSGVEVDE